MAVAAGAVHDDRFVAQPLQDRRKVSIVAGKVVSREVQRSRDVPSFEKPGRPGIKDEGTLALNG